MPGLRLMDHRLHPEVHTFPNLDYAPRSQVARTSQTLLREEIPACHPGPARTLGRGARR